MFWENQSLSAAAEVHRNERVLSRGKCEVYLLQQSCSEMSVFYSKEETSPFRPPRPLAPLFSLPLSTPFLPISRVNRMLHLHLGFTLPSRLERLAVPFVGIAPVCVSNSSLVDYDE